MTPSGYGSVAQTGAASPRRGRDAEAPRAYVSAISGIRARPKTTVGVRPKSWLEWFGGGDGVMLIGLPVVTYFVTMELFAWLSFFYLKELVVAAFIIVTFSFMQMCSVPKERKDGVKTKFKAVSLMLGIFMGSYVGWYIHQKEVLQYYVSSHGQRYTNVLPKQAAASQADAAVIDFAAGAYVMLGEAVGFMPVQSTQRYCVAPILDTAQTNDVQFWAVGVDCCEREGSFTCDAAGDRTAEIPDPEPNRGPHSGVRVFDLGSFVDDADHYQAAIRMAESNSELRGAEDAILVRWVFTAGVEDVIAEKWHRAHLSLLVAGVIGSLPLAAGGVTASRAFQHAAHLM